MKDLKAVFAREAPGARIVVATIPPPKHFKGFNRTYWIDIVKLHTYVDHGSLSNGPFTSDHYSYDEALTMREIMGLT